MKIIDPALSRTRATAGRKGGYSTFFKHGREKMREWAQLGGRPRSLTLAEIQSQSSSRSKNIERGTGCAPVNLPLAIMRALGRKIKEGELAASAPAGSPEGGF